MKSASDKPLHQFKSEVDLIPEEIRDWYKEQVKQAELNGEPYFYHTGIKFKVGVPVFKVRYECPNCRNKGQQYEPIDAEETQCHECQSKIDVVKVKKFPFPDGFKNYFVTLDSY